MGKDRPNDFRKFTLDQRLLANDNIFINRLLHFIKVGVANNLEFRFLVVDHQFVFVGIIALLDFISVVFIGLIILNQRS